MDRDHAERPGGPVREPVLYGSDYSVYVRIVRLALIEKSVDHRREQVDVFAPEGVPAWYLAKHPFGFIPAFEHGDLILHETSAITRYVDEAFDGPALQPRDAAARASMAMVIGMLDSYGYRPMVWDIAVELTELPKSGEEPDLAKVERAVPRARLVLGALEKRLSAADWLAGSEFSLADLHAAPILGYFLRAPRAGDMLADFPSVGAWWRRVSRRPSFVATRWTDDPV